MRLAAVLSKTLVAGEGQQRWLKEEQERVLGAYQAASGRANSWSEVVEQARAASDDSHAAFWALWVAEQLRLARLFPKPTSEVFPLKESDVSGFELPDRTFALTFDDGPTGGGGHTDETVAMLREERLPATFFVQGERLATRRDARTLYRGFCVASHGESHVRHLELKAAMSSINTTRAQLVSAVDAPRLDLFRPPYGQRGDSVATWLELSRVRTVLWNVDSLDWRGDAKTEEVAGRVLALMLVQRRGVVLFHDVHPAAAQVVPMLKKALGSAVEWADCEAL
jgi:peptidoglycan/xylan/chitin deacetylase (PgdA/CDA1 family)